MDPEPPLPVAYLARLYRRPRFPIASPQLYTRRILGTLLRSLASLSSPLLRFTMPLELDPQARHLAVSLVPPSSRLSSQTLASKY
ncbi:hypothetical protein NMY22_g13695 [Coprinellus aureogranulatus]|nr:hypothetical protein NMY22_g13695 [Coprinellus aureogranulatus]